MSYNRQTDIPSFVVNNYKERDTAYDENIEYSARSHVSNTNPYYPQVDPLSPPSEHKYAHQPHYKYLPTGVPDPDAKLLVFPFDSDRNQFMCPSILPFSSIVNRAPGAKRPPNLAEIKLVLGFMSNSNGGKLSSEESMDRQICSTIFSLLLITLILFVMLYLGPFWFFVGNQQFFIIFFLILIAVIAFWGYFSIKTTADDHKELARRLESVIKKVNQEWAQERVAGTWKLGKQAGWLELEVQGNFSLQEKTYPKFVNENYDDRGSRSPERLSPKKRFDDYQNVRSDPLIEFDDEEEDRIAEMRLRMQYEGLNPTNQNPLAGSQSVTKIDASPIHEYPDSSKNFYEPAQIERSINPQISQNQSQEYYKQRALEEVRQKYGFAKESSGVDSKEIYRTPGYLSRESSPSNQMSGKTYVGNYRDHKRISDNYGEAQVPSYTSNFKNSNLGFRDERKTPSDRWFNETQEQEDRFGSRGIDKTPYDSVESNTRYVPYKNESRSRSGSRGEIGKGRFAIYEDNDIPRGSSNDRKMPYNNQQEHLTRKTNRLTSPRRFEEKSPQKRYDDYGDF